MEPNLILRRYQKTFNACKMASSGKTFLRFHFQHNFHPQSDSSSIFVVVKMRTKEEFIANKRLLATHAAALYKKLLPGNVRDLHEI